MLTLEKHPTIYYSKFILSLLFFIAGYNPSVLAVNYNVVAGSQILITTANSIMEPTAVDDNILVLGPLEVPRSPILGGFSQTNGICVTPDKIIQVDGWNGININNIGIIAGFTGRISGGIVTIKGMPSYTEKFVYTGGLLFNNRGYVTAEGDVPQHIANNLCASVEGPFPREINAFSAPNDTEWGNKLASVDGYMWIYTSSNVPLGTYPLNTLSMSQGGGYINYASIALTLPGDTITVLPPPCTISTLTTINFDISSPGGRKVSAPITYQCGELDSNPVLDAYLIANAIGNTLSTTELALTSSGGSQPGGAVRGYVGQNVNIDNVNCTNTNASLSFNGTFNTKLAPVTNGVSLQIPLVWQLCLKGNEVPGIATASAVLDIGYK